MSSEEYLQIRHEQNVKQFAHKFIEKNMPTGTLRDLSDENMRESFKDCVIPLRPCFYDECREQIRLIVGG